MKTVQEIENKPGRVKRKLEDIIVDISWAKVSKRYFGKSPSWIYHKIDGLDGNGFTPEEMEQFKEALKDLADRINKAADAI